MISEGWTDVIPEKEVALLETGRLQEIEQPLIDLGYLKGDAINRAMSSRVKKLANAIRLFRKDYITAGLLPDYAPNFARLPHHELDGVELNLIHQLTGLDNEFPITALPSKGKTTLYSRVLHYRLIVLGVFTKKVSVLFGSGSLQSLKTVGSFLNIQQEATLLEITGNIPQLIKQVTDTEKLQKTAIAFKYSTRKKQNDALLEVVEEAGESDNEAELIKEEQAIDSEIKKLTANIFSKQEEEIQRLEKRNKNKNRRLEKVTRCINQLVHEDKMLFEATDQLRKDLELKKKPILAQKKLLERDLVRLSNEALKIKQQVGPQPDKKAIRKKKKAIEKLKKKLKKEKKEPQLLAEIGNLEHNITILNRSVTSLNKRRGDHRPIIKRLTGQITDSQKSINNLNDALLDHAALRQHKEELLLMTKVDPDKAINKAKLRSIKTQQTQARNLIKGAKENVKKKDEQLKLAIKKRDEKVRANQKRIEPLQDRLIRLRKKINGLRFKFKAQLKRSLDKDYYKELKREVFQKRNKAYLKKLAEDPFNKFVIRLVQVRQWMNGYYYGRLDSQPADRTFLSIVELTEEEALKRLRLKYVLTKLGNKTEGYWLLNGEYFFDCICELESKGKAKNSAELIKEYEDSFKKDPIYKNKVTEEAWNEFTEEIEEGIKDTQHNIRRFYYGVRSLARSIGRVVGKLVRLIINGIKSVIRIFKNFIKILYKEIREGARKFFQGMEFLFGKRQIESTLVSGETLVTKFDFDFDVTVWSTNDVTTDLYKSHITKTMSYALNMSFSLRLVAKILKWTFTLTSGALTWPRLALKIAFHFKDLVLKFLLKRKAKKLVGVS